MWLLAVLVYVPAVWFWSAALNGTRHPSPYDGPANHAANVELARVSALDVAVPLIGALLGTGLGKLSRTGSTPLAAAIGTICSLMAWYCRLLAHLQLTF